MSQALNPSHALRAERRVLPPGQFGGVSIPPTANVPCAPHRTPANLASGDSGHADTTNQCPTRSAEEGDLRGYAVRLMKRRWRHGLRRRCDGQGKSSNSDQPEHWLSPMFGFKHRSRLVQDKLARSCLCMPCSFVYNRSFVPEVPGIEPKKPATDRASKAFKLCL